MSNSYLVNNILENETQRIVDYFAVVGLPTRLTSVKASASATSAFSLNLEDNFTLPANSELQKSRYDLIDPIVDIQVLNKSFNESVPEGYECLWLTKSRNSANLNYTDNVFYKPNEMFLCIRRGKDMPPITDIGVFYEGQERVMPGITVIRKTIGGNPANVNSNPLTADRTFVTYRRSLELACNSLAVIDICVVIKSKVRIVSLF